MLVAGLDRFRKAFPGRYRPGLIEAMKTYWTHAGHKRTFPGRYRPGLIEASAGSDKVKVR